MSFCFKKPELIFLTLSLFLGVVRPWQNPDLCEPMLIIGYSWGIRGLKAPLGVCPFISLSHWVWGTGSLLTLVGRRVFTRMFYLNTVTAYCSGRSKLIYYCSEVFVISWSICANSDTIGNQVVSYLILLNHHFLSTSCRHLEQRLENAQN